MAEESCGTCRYWRRSAPLQPIGLCRRRPPTLVFMGTLQGGKPVTDTFWPMVPDLEWCGEHAARGNGRTIDLAAIDVDALEGQA